MFVGDRVRDVECDDVVGVVTRPYHHHNNPNLYREGWWVFWETGAYAGEELWSEDSDLIEDEQ